MLRSCCGRRALHRPGGFSSAPASVLLSRSWSDPSCTCPLTPSIHDMEALGLAGLSAPSPKPSPLSGVGVREAARPVREEDTVTPTPGFPGLPAHEVAM